MSALRAVLVGAILGVGLAIGMLAPAHAAPHPADAAIAAAASDTVTGQPWSAPAYPVDCYASNRQVACTPQNTADTQAQQCFINVFLDEAKATVCTTYEAHIAAIKTSGGKPLLVEYGCSLGDAVCLSFENAGRGLALSATSSMLAVAQNMRFDTGSLLWTAAVGEWSFWQWAILVITFAAMVWAIAAAAVTGDRAELIGALVRSFIAIPAVPISLWLTGHLLNAIDDLMWYLMNRDGADALFATLQGVMWAGGQANYFFAFLLHGLLMIGMLLLMLVFAFRNIVLAALIAVGPVAWMLFPMRGVGPQWVVRYVSAVVVLLLTGPLTIGFVTLIINGLATVRTIWDPRSWPLLVGFVLVAFAPFAVFGLFSFVGAVTTDTIGSQLGSGARRAATQGSSTLTRVPSRIGARPAGASAGGGSAASPGAPGAAPPRGPSSPAGSPAGKADTAATPATQPAPTPNAPAPTGNATPRPAERTA